MSRSRSLVSKVFTSKPTGLQVPDPTPVPTAVSNPGWYGVCGLLRVLPRNHASRPPRLEDGHGFVPGLGCADPHRSVDAQQTPSPLSRARGGCCRGVRPRRRHRLRSQSSSLWASPRGLRNRSVIAAAGTAECIPLTDRSMDTVVMTWTGCSISCIRAAFREMRRVLSPGGRLLFVEHGRAPEPNVARWQERLDPFWVRFSGGCHLSRKIDDLLSEAGFRIEEVKTRYIPVPKITAFLYEGAARPR